MSAKSLLKTSLMVAVALAVIYRVEAVREPLINPQTA